MKEEVEYRQVEQKESGESREESEKKLGGTGKNTHMSRIQGQVEISQYMYLKQVMKLATIGSNGRRVHGKYESFDYNCYYNVILKFHLFVFSII